MKTFELPGCEFVNNYDDIVTSSNTKLLSCILAQGELNNSLKYALRKMLMRKAITAAKKPNRAASQDMEWNYSLVQ